MRLRLLLALLAAPACATSKADAPKADHDTGRVLAQLKRVPALGAIAIEGISIERDGRVVMPSTGMLAHRALRAVLPATGPKTHLEVGDDAFSLDVTPLDVTSGSVDTEKNALVRHGVARATDAAFIARPEEIEELRILRSADAPRLLRWKLELGSGVSSLRVRDDRIELLDHEGYVRLQSPRPFAIDARGVRIDLSPRLAAGDEHILELDVALPADAAFPVVVDPLWTTRAPMKTARSLHGAVVLPSGQLLVMGGTNAGGATSSAEIYDPATNTWTATTSMNRARGVAFAVLLSSGTKAGKVFVVGGDDQKSTELYDPVAKTWSLSGSMTLTRGNPAVVQLASGKVLAMGGDFDASEHRAEIYTPDAGTWAFVGAVGSPPGQAGGMRAALLPGGNVLVAGGTVFGLTTGAAYLYRAATNDFVSTAALPTAPTNHTMTALSTGSVLAAGGFSKTSYMGAPNYPTTLEIYSAASGVWSAGPSLGSARQLLAATLLSTNRVLFTGGDSGGAPIASAELYDPVSNTVVPITSMAQARESQTSTLLPDGTVVVAGGVVSGTYLASVELFAQGAVGAACGAVAGWECKSGFCVDGTCCSTSSCAAGLHCDAPSKKGTCAKYKGATCGSDAECETGHCADGVCCDSACNGTCEACNIAAKVGTCSIVSGAPATGHGTCSAGTSVCSKQSCNGVDRTACHFASTATACGAKACTSSIETHTSTCDGSGACKDVPVACGAYVCNAATSACFASCSTSSACAAGYYCKGTTCVPVEGLGSACDATVTCGGSLSCVDGVCCATATCAAGSSCSVPGHLGTCTKVTGSACTSAAECGSGFCVDGYCCDRACDGQCEACDGLATLGVCSPVVGAPHGARSACASDPDKPCAASSCDGTDRTTCAKFAGSDVSCRAPSCKDGVLTANAVCDGSGACPAETTATCDGYACKDGTACRTNCTDDTHCAMDFHCLRGKCAKQSGTCSADGTSVVAADGTAASCAPYRCKDTACQSSCASTDECQSPAICDTATSTCSTPTAADPGSSDDGGGCTMARKTGKSGLFSLVSLLGLALLLRRSAR